MKLNNSVSRLGQSIKRVRKLSPTGMLYKKVFDLHDGILLMFEVESGRIITVNQAAVKFFKISLSEFLQKDIFDLTGLSIEQFLKKRQEASQTGRSFVVLAQRFPGGDVKYLEYRCTSIRLPKEDVLFCHVQDVTSHEHEEYLLQYRIEFESIVSSISTYFIRPDHTQLDYAIRNALKTVGEFLVADRCYLLRFSEDLARLSMIHVWNNVSVKALQEFENIITETSPLAYGALFKGEILKVTDLAELPAEADLLKKYKLQDDTKSFIIVPMISAGMVIGAIGLDTVHQERTWTTDTESLLRMVGEIITNALRRKQIEEALRESENKYRQFFEEDLTGDYIAAPNGQIRFCNPAFAKIFGFDRIEDILGSKSNIYELLNQSAEKYIAPLRKAGSGVEIEFEFRRKSGEIARVIGKISGVFDEQGILSESRGYLFDITEHKKLEEQLRGAQRMEAVGRLAGGIAHDFNNILTVINGHSELVLAESGAASPARNNIEQIKKAGDKAASLISQLLAFSRKQIVQPKVINLNTVVKDLESMLRRLIGENIRFETRLDPQLGNIKIDPTQLEQVIMNLAVNSKDAMPAGGILTIETRNSYIDEHYARLHNPQRPGSYVMLSVKDTGIGMDKETQLHIFEPFFTTKEKGKGTGLGLSTLYGIVKQSDGFVWVDSIPQQGATFSIYFPVYDQSEEEKQTVSYNAEPLCGTETILIVEDDDAVRDLTRSFLLHYGYTVYSANGGEQALQVCAEPQTSIDLAVIDVIMPGINCQEVARSIKKFFPKVKVLFISGYTDESITQQGILETGVAFLQKPFGIEALGMKIRQVLDSKLP